MKPLLVAASLLLPLALSLTLQEDDLVFDDVGEPSASGSSLYGADEYRDHDKKHDRTRIDNKKHNVERLWGIPDTSVVVGHVFKMRILKQAFSGSVDHFEVKIFHSSFIHSRIFSTIFYTLFSLSFFTY